MLNHLGLLLTIAITGWQAPLVVASPQPWADRPTHLTRSTQAKTDQVESVKVIYNPEFNPNLATARLNTYERHNIPIPQYVRAAAAAGRSARRGENGSAPAWPILNERQYVVPVDIGTPPQRLNLQFDTGSADLWVFSSLMPKDEAEGHLIYNPAESETSQRYGNETWFILYQDFTGAGGDVYWDEVRVGSLNVPKQAVEVAKQVGSPLLGQDGVFGLGFDSDNQARPEQVKTWFTNIKDSLREPLFTANLNHHADGTYNFGSIDHSEHYGTITYAALSDRDDGAWGWMSTGYAIGNDTFQDMPINSITDTGATLLLLPDDILAAYYKQVTGSFESKKEGGWVMNCTITPPDFTFGVGQARITVPGHLINYRPSVEPDMCSGGIQSGGDLAVFGDVALKAALAVFDVGNKRMGWAPKRVTGY